MKVDSKNIIVCGDIHGDWKALNKLIKDKQPETILQCGDFGYWPNLKQARLYDVSTGKFITEETKVENGYTKIYFCDGNHEDHDSLRKLVSTEVYPNVFYMKRGSVLTLPDKINVLFLGGASSIDRRGRTPGYDWFSEEILTEKDIENLPDCKIDIVVSHTCPNEFKPVINDRFENDLSRVILSYILDKYNPCLWYFSHWHVYKTGRFADTKWICLNMSNKLGWWEYL
ncbi:MAG: metallophosphoesterase [Desulfobacterales bacterium]|nr:metallophosphoesterase [Desulfobacterales bacterium]